MKILLIDNHSKHREELIKLLKNEAIVETQEQLNNSDIDLYDLVVLSGGSNTPSVFYNPSAYTKEIDFVKNTKSPVLGICLGSEIITKAFGGTLQDLGSTHRGEVLVTITDENLQDCIGSNYLRVYEAHEIITKDIPKDFLVCAHSKHGIEIIKHKTKPIIGVQFHPEVETNIKLIKWLMRALKIPNNSIVTY